MSIKALWRTGGLALTLGFLTLFIGGGARHGIGLVLKPMAESLDWDRTLLGAVIAVFMVMTAFTMLAVGRLSDRYSPAWILSGGFFVSALGIGAMAFAETAWQAFLLYGVVFAIGNGAVSITPVGVMLTRRFGSQAGIANSIAIAGMGLGQLLILSGLSVVLVEAGWRDVFLWLGAINLIAAPLLLVALRREAPAGRAYSTSPTEGMSLADARRTPGFWLLMAFYGICGFQDFFVSSHVVAFALDQGEGTLFAGNLLAFMGLAGLVGVLADACLFRAQDRHFRINPGRPLAAVHRGVCAGLWRHFLGDSAADRDLCARPVQRPESGADFRSGDHGAPYSGRPRGANRRRAIR